MLLMFFEMLRRDVYPASSGHHPRLLKCCPSLRSAELHHLWHHPPLRLGPGAVVHIMPRPERGMI